MFHRVACWVFIVMIVTMSAPCAFGSSDDHSEASSLNPLSLESIQQDLAIWTAVVFLLLLAILTKFAWKPLAEGLDKREQHVADQIAEAEAANEKAEQILADYRRQLAAAQDQVHDILNQGRRDAEQQGHVLIDKAKEEAQAEHQRALKQIEAATAAAIKELADQSATLAVELAGKIVRAKLSPNEHSRLIDEAVGGFMRAANDASSVSRN